MSARFRKLRHEIAGPRDALLAVRIGLWAAALRILKHLVPLPVLIRIVRLATSRDDRDPHREQQIVTLSRWACRLWSGRRRGECLERSLVTFRYLSAAGAEPRLVVGFAPGDGRGVRGHAWVVVDGQAVDESVNSLADFAPFASFGPDGTAATAPQ